MGCLFSRERKPTQNQAGGSSENHDYPYRPSVIMVNPQHVEIQMPSTQSSKYQQLCNGIVQAILYFYQVLLSEFFLRMQQCSDFYHVFSSVKIVIRLESQKN
jgi:hypothetical protein